ncbi:MAG: hypothetical protein PGN34_18335 [Methylobacterium frigidaeris]
MTNDKSLSYNQLVALCGHLQEVVETVTAANNSLIARLSELPTFGPAERDVLNQWSLILNDIHTASEVHVTAIRSERPASALQ